MIKTDINGLFGGSTQSSSKLKLDQENIKDASLSVRKSLKDYTIRSTSRHCCFLSHCFSKQYMHALRPQEMPN